jgi:hypothetical protein
VVLAVQALLQAVDLPLQEGGVGILREPHPTTTELAAEQWDISPDQAQEVTRQTPVPMLQELAAEGLALAVEMSLGMLITPQLAVADGVFAVVMQIKQPEQAAAARLAQG